MTVVPLGAALTNFVLNHSTNEALAVFPEQQSGAAIPPLIPAALNGPGFHSSRKSSILPDKRFVYPAFVDTGACFFGCSSWFFTKFRSCI
jgi:hypothetical protein